jgi:hypothetical protein
MKAGIAPPRGVDHAVIAGHSASEDARERAYIPAIHVFAHEANKT